MHRYRLLPDNESKEKRSRLHNVVWNTTTSLWAVTFDVTGFSGLAVAAGNQLSWQTASEQNTSYFAVQRAVAGSSSFVDLGRVAAAGNSSLTRQYSYTDALASTHPSYSYRLKMVDEDGQYTYSPIVTVLDMSGARLVQRSVVLQKGDNALDVSTIAGLPQGVYILQVTSGTQQQTVKFVKE
jgi:hypothetical protein